MNTSLRLLEIPSGSAVLNVLDTLRDTLDGKAPPQLPVPSADARESRRLVDALRPGDAIDDDVALVVATSGSTGVPKGAMLSAAALRASGTATHERLGGAGSWLLALPAHHIAGLQVLLRSVLCGTEPVVLDVSAGFEPSELADAVAAMPGPRRYTSLVPTQLVKALDDPEATRALATLDAVLLGGAATPAPLRERAAARGITLVRTYGMSETCGGCVYDGRALSGVRVRIEDGRVLLGGATLASGYRGLPQHPAFAEPGWFRTDDAGQLDDAGTLTVTGRLDDAISTGGLTVVPHIVEEVLAQHPSVRECAVLGVPDARLGERVVAAIVAVDPVPSLDELRAHVGAHLDATAAPREILVLDSMPLRGPGKINRKALRDKFS